MAESRKTERILVIFHLLRRCKEVAFKEVTDIVPVSRKTVSRDICLLRQLGFQIEFVKEDGAFVLLPGRQPPCFPESGAQRLRLQRILRLIDMMCRMERAGDPAAWFRKEYPELGLRTMQRDFKTLTSIGYTVQYVRGDEWHRPNRYYCEWPMSTWEDVRVPEAGQRTKGKGGRF